MHKKPKIKNKICVFSRLVEDEIFDRIECIVIQGKIVSYIYI